MNAAKYLASKGADCTAKDKDSRNTLHLAIKGGISLAKVVEDPDVSLKHLRLDDIQMCECLSVVLSFFLSFFACKGFCLRMSTSVEASISLDEKID